MCACASGRTGRPRVEESRDPATALWVGGLNSDKAAFGDFQTKARHTHCVPQANCKKRGDELVAGLGCLAMGQRWPDHSRFWPKPPNHLRPLARCGQGLLTAQRQSEGKHQPRSPLLTAQAGGTGRIESGSPLLGRTVALLRGRTARSPGIPPQPDCQGMDQAGQSPVPGTEACVEVASGSRLDVRLKCR